MLPSGLRYAQLYGARLTLGRMRGVNRRCYLQGYAMRSIYSARLTRGRERDPLVREKTRARADAREEIGVRKIRNHELRECAGRSPNEKEGVVFLQLDLEEISVKNKLRFFLDD